MKLRFQGSHKFHNANIFGKVQKTPSTREWDIKEEKNQKFCLYSKWNENEP